MEWLEEDNMSFEDSERFDEDSLCSWLSDRESVCNHWRGWRKQPASNTYRKPNETVDSNDSPVRQSRTIHSLVELAAREVASNVPFEVVEHVYPPVPLQLQMRIAFWSFPESEEDIRLYSCLATGSAEEFLKGDQLFKSGATEELLQIGFHLSATVRIPLSLVAGQQAPKASGLANPKKQHFDVAVTFDRRRITSCNCTCSSQASWCSHVVAVCLHRIHESNSVFLRAPVSESLSRLHRDQLQKFAQYLIAELPQQILPTAQRLLDELLLNHESEINTCSGAPDPTAGASMYEQTSWCLDEGTLHDNIRKILVKLALPSPIVFSDVNYLSSTSPPAASEWQTLLRPLRGQEPEGIWNLLSMVREMFRRADRNAVPLLDLITEEVLSCEQLLVWWFNTRVALHTGSPGPGARVANNGGVPHGTSQYSQHTCAALCEEIVMLWRLAALNPALAPSEKTPFYDQMCRWHCKVLEIVYKTRNTTPNASIGSGNGNHVNRKVSDFDVFTGFKPALESCLIDWVDYPIPGVTYSDQCDKRFYMPFMQLRVNDTPNAHGSRTRPTEFGKSNFNNLLLGPSSTRSSLSSEGFNENLNNNVSDASSAENREAEPRPNARAEEPEERPEDRPAEAENVVEGAAAPVDPPAANPDDEYQLYYYDAVQARAIRNLAPPTQKKSPIPTSEELSRQIKRPTERLEILFSRAEALHAHGHTAEACKLAYHLTQELLANPQPFVMDTSATPNPSPSTSTVAHGKGINGGKRAPKSKFNLVSHQASLQASATLSKAAFLCQVLGENHTDHHYLAFRIGIFGLEMVRPPASTKPLEVRLINQEQDLVTLLKRVPLGHSEMHDLRERAAALRDQRLVSRGEALLPLMLASYIFDALVTSKETSPSRSGSNSSVICKHRLPTDEELGFEAAVAALGLKANVSESDHPLLCEGTRRQRGELAITLLLHYRDDQMKLAAIMDKLMDKDVHQMYKNQAATTDPSLYSTGGKVAQSAQRAGPSHHFDDEPGTPDRGREAKPQPDLSSPYQNARTDKGFEASPQDPNAFDISPSTIRRRIAARAAAMESSDSGSSGESSDGFASSSSGSRNADQSAAAPSALLPPMRSAQTERPSRSVWRAACNPENPARTLASFRAAYRGCHQPFPPCQPPSRAVMTKGVQKRNYPSLPNQPSEASAHFMFELAKTVFTKAGGNSSLAAHFTQMSPAQNRRRPHRALHMCSFQIGLYAIGLTNAVSPNWLSRTYSSQVSWITGQAMEIGCSAISFLIQTWEGHLTPTEVIALADKASRGRDQPMQRACAELALSCLPHAHALNQNEIRRALLQCKEQCIEMLKRACLAVEQAAQGGGIIPEVLFDVARRWYDLYEESHGGETNAQNFAFDPVCQQGQAFMPRKMSLMHYEHYQGPPNQPMPTPAGYIYPHYPPPMMINAPPYLPPYNNYPSPPMIQSYYANSTFQRRLVTPPIHPNQMLPPHGGMVPMHPNQHPNQMPNQPHPNQMQNQPHPSQMQNQPHPNQLQNQPHPNQMQNQSHPNQMQNQSHPPMPPNQHPGPPGSHGQQQPAGAPTLPAENNHQSSESYKYLIAAYRVGLLAMDVLAKKIHDERMQAKYARTPPYGEDVKWLLGLAKKLGNNSLQDLCKCIVNTVASPFILYEVIMETAQHIAKTQPSATSHQVLKSPLLAQLIPKCQQMFVACIHAKLFHITAAEYDEFLNTIRACKQAFQLSPNGVQQFSEHMQNLRRSKSCRKELWTKICAVHQNMMTQPNF